MSPDRGEISLGCATEEQILRFLPARGAAWTPGMSRFITDPFNVLATG